MKILVDFDGTCVLHAFPKIGADAPGAVEVLKKLVKHGHQLILFTMRSNQTHVSSDEYEIHDKADFYLDYAVQWFEEKGIELHGVQADPDQHKWTASPKAYGQIHIDDAGIGCPLVRPERSRSYVDWPAVDILLEEEGCYD